MHVGYDGVKAGQHPMICDLFKGFFNERPSRPRYADTWDVDVVLKCLEDLGQNDSMELKWLSIKVTMLMALTSAARASEIHLISLEHITDLGDKLVCDLDGLTKVRKTGQPPESLTFEVFTGDEALDVVSCMREYMKRTKNIRKSKQLLVSFRSPHNSITVTTISRWLRWCMERAGIDTATFKAHSVRGAATSKARVKGLTTGQIMQKANWSRASTFRRFYLRNISDNFQKAVLSVKSMTSNIP